MSHVAKQVRRHDLLAWCRALHCLELALSQDASLGANYIGHGGCDVYLGCILCIAHKCKKVRPHN